MTDHYVYQGGKDKHIYFKRIIIISGSSLNQLYLVQYIRQ